MSNHATVIEVMPIWVTQHQRQVLRLELPNGKRSCVPEGMTAKVGDVLCLVTAAEFELILSKRKKGKHEQESSGRGY